MTMEMNETDETMATMNIPEFSSIEQITSNIVDVDQECPIHHIKMVSAYGREPICVECAKSNLEDQKKAANEKAKSDIDKQRNYYFFRDNSIIVDATLKDATLDNFNEVDEETRNNKQLARQIAGGYFKGEVFNAIFHGKPGTGKSHLAMSVLKAVNDHSEPYRKCLFVSLDEAMRLIRDSFNHHESKYSEQYVTELMIKPELLVIDDLGAETGAISTDKMASDFTIRILYAVLNGRANKSTIITTNLSSAEMSAMYDAKLTSRLLRGTAGHRIAFKDTTDKRLGEF